MSSSTSSSRRFALAFATVFSVTVFIFVLASEVLVRLYVMPTDDLDQRRRAFRTTTASIAAFGDSRVIAAIVPDENFAMFANGSENLHTILGKLNAYLDSGRAHRILLQAAPHHFAAYRLNSDQSELLREFLSPTNGALQMMRPHIRRYLFDYWLAVLRDPMRLLFSRTSQAAPASPGPVFTEVPIDARRKEAMIRTQFHLPVRGFSETREMQLVRETMTRMRDIGVQICMVTFPVSTDYREAAGKFPEFGKVREFYREFADANGVTYLDLWNRYDDRYFANSDHLNTDGAHKLTREVRRDCFDEGL